MQTPPSTSYHFARARYVTNIPEPHDLTPLNSPFAPSPSTVLRHLLSQPEPPVAQSREIILEYVLGREQKYRTTKHGKGGKGTLGREGFEEIGKRLGEIEQGLQDASSLALLLSIRLSLSYFTLRELADQLLLLPISDAERTIVQHIRRRLPGEGRFGVGKELEQVESLVSSRPALRPAFRSAKTRTLLPQQPKHPIPLPAPSKAIVIKQISAQPDSSFALEMVSEYLTREKREYMMKTKWAKSGREQLGKDLGDMEAAVPSLLPVFLVLRRTFALPPSPLPSDVVEPYLDVLPVPPDPDDVPFRQPTVQSTTAALYVNPRLDDKAAARVLDELVESEKEKIPVEDHVEWIGRLIDNVQKRASLPVSMSLSTR